MKIKNRKISELLPAEYNPRQLTEKQFKELQQSFKNLDILEPAVVNMNPDRLNVIISGHQRIKAAAALGKTEYPCLEVSFSIEKEKEANIRMNKNTGEWDMDALANNFKVDDLIEWGFDNLDFGSEDVGGMTDEDDVPEAPEEPVTKPGDLYILGEHRLLCGDSTNIQHVERLVDGEKADMVFTDPPYGVDYDGGSKKREKLKDDHIGTDIYTEVIPVLSAFCEGPCYTWYADTKPIGLYNTVNECGNIHALIIWVKNNSTFNMNIHYKQKHEPCLYWKPKGATLRWGGNNKEDTVWELDRESRNEFHPTQKPVGLAERAIGNHDAKSVLDLFGGSGSTLIACEKTSRKCRMMELDPKYCDVIVKRWEEFTGKKAELLAGGGTL